MLVLPPEPEDPPELMVPPDPPGPVAPLPAPVAPPAPIAPPAPVAPPPAPVAPPRPLPPSPAAPPAAPVVPASPVAPPSPLPPPTPAVPALPARPPACGVPPCSSRSARTLRGTARTSLPGIDPSCVNRRSARPGTTRRATQNDRRKHHCQTFNSLHQVPAPPWGHSQLRTITLWGWWSAAATAAEPEKGVRHPLSGSGSGRRIRFRPPAPAAGPAAVTPARQPRGAPQPGYDRHAAAPWCAGPPHRR